jgi:hypothetical protein
MTPHHPHGAMPAHTGADEAAYMPKRVEIRIRGTVPGEVAERLGLQATFEPAADTVLRGAIVDRPALHGVLDRLRASGHELVEVRRLPDREVQS